MLSFLSFFGVILGILLVYKRRTGVSVSEKWKKFCNYFRRVVDRSRKNLEGGQVVPIVTQLNTYSQTMQAWYQQVSAEDTESEEESESENQVSLRKAEVEDQKSVIPVPIITSTRIASTQTQINTFAEEVPNPRNRRNPTWRYENFSSHSTQEPCDIHRIRQIQSSQLKSLLRDVRFLGERDLRAPLIICVEANSTNISGYLLNLKERVCKFYVYGIKQLPFDLETKTGEWDNTEFKMKNVLFALLLWEKEILIMKKFSLFANCWAVNHPDCPFGKTATDFLEHFTFCKNVIRVNSNSQVSRYRDTDLFARLIQPARELMSFNLSRFRQYIRNAYGILEFEGSHSFLDNYQHSAKDDGYFAKTLRHQFFLDKVNENADKWNTGCRNCNFKLSKRSALRSRVSESEDSDEGILPYPLNDNFW